ncbi:hypothetical protein [Crocosphaera sp.]|uniref:hypothetical protein n=1 Tax=Crocosphaera sp. TaxID=2729996 RepID=UPI003F24F645
MTQNIISIIIGVMDNNEQFITWESTVAFTFATLAVWSISNSIRVLLNWKSRIPCFITSFLVAYLTISFTKNLDSFRLSYLSVLDYPIVSLNACLLFLSSLGLQTASTSSSSQEKQHPRQRVKWLTYW